MLQPALARVPDKKKHHVHRAGIQGHLSRLGCMEYDRVSRARVSCCNENCRLRIWYGFVAIVVHGIVGLALFFFLGLISIQPYVDFGAVPPRYAKHQERQRPRPPPPIHPLPPSTEN